MSRTLSRDLLRSAQGGRARIISDSGSQFRGRYFIEFARILGMSHVRTSPHHPQSNGKIEQFNRMMNTECIRSKVPVSLENAKRIV